MKKIPRHKKKIQSIAVLTSGGDAPGMNAAIRAVVRYGLSRGIRVFGVLHGYRGLVEGLFKELDRKSVANVIQRGGTVLKTDRCLEFHERKVRREAAKLLRSHGIDALVVIGGDGSFRGAHALWKEEGLPVAGVPGTIDNDLTGTDFTIGFDTAVNTAMLAIDRIRDTASSHERTFVVEVMGRNTGYIALDVGIGGGAEAVVVPEWKTSVTEVARRVKAGMDRGKTSSIIVMAEGEEPGGSFALAEQLKKRYGIDAKVAVLGHVQRGGAPTVRDRKIASLMGIEAVRLLADGFSDFMVGVTGEEPVAVALTDAVKHRSKLKREWEELARVLAM